MATVIDGRAIAERLKQDVQERLSSFPIKPKLAILSFNTPASRIYFNAQLRVAEQLGIEVQIQSKRRMHVFEAFGPESRGLPWKVQFEEIKEIIEDWNTDSAIHGIFVHQPMPPQIDPQRISALIDPAKDIEGIHPQNSARRFFAKARIGSCTALAVMELIESTGTPLEGKEAVVVGHSEIVGRPVSMLLLDKLATTTVCHVATKHLSDHVKRADVLVVAAGQPHLIKGERIKPGAVVIDVGINVVSGRVVGDVEFEAAKQRAAFISPVPGGVGPVTVMMVMKNTVEAFKLQQAAT